MINIFLAFITGLTTGGLSCLAVQGGLLAGSLAGKIEKDLQNQPAAKRSQRRRPGRSDSNNLTQPIIAFLAAKILVYTMLGFLLGSIGQVFQLSPIARAILQIGIGLFMLGTALRMMNVHPIFRYFTFEPPAFIRRKLRKTAAKGNESLITPIFLGLLTVFIPCGITQAMLAVALASANPLEGAALMFAFTLGTSPVFFALVYFASQLGKKLERQFTRAAAILILVIGLFTIDGGITLAGSPISLTRLVGGLTPWSLTSLEPSSVQAGQVESAPGNLLTINIKNGGYEPKILHAQAGEPIQLKLVSNRVFSCALSFVIPSLGIQENLEPTDEIWIDIPSQAAGTTLPFSCSMGMFTGKIIFE